MFQPAIKNCIRIFLFVSCLLGESQAGVWGDDFNDGDLKGWTRADNDAPGLFTWTWENTGDALKVFVTFDRREILGVRSALEFTAFRVKAEQIRASMTVRSRKGDLVGIWIGRQSDTLDRWRYAYLFSGAYVLEPLAFAPQDIPALDAKYGPLTQMEVVFDRGRFQFRSRGKTILEFKDDHFDTITLIGIGVMGGRGGHAVLDNFVMSGSTIPDGPPFAVAPRDKLTSSWGALKRR